MDRLDLYEILEAWRTARDAGNREDRITYAKALREAIDSKRYFFTPAWYEPDEAEAIRIDANKSLESIEKPIEKPTRSVSNSCPHRRGGNILTCARCNGRA